MVGQEAYFDQVPGRAAGGRSANAPVRVRAEAAAGDDEEEDDDDEDYEDMSDGDEDGEEDEEEEDEEDNEARARPPPRRSARTSGRPGASTAEYVGARSAIPTTHQPPQSSQETGLFSR